jgi:hypothetical protein
MKKQLRLDGSVDTPAPSHVLERNADGSLPDKHRKAIEWYVMHYGMKPLSVSAWPVFHFLDHTSNRVTANLADILEEYEQFKRTTHGKRQQAA